MRSLKETAGEADAPRRRTKIVYSLLAILGLVALVPLAAFAHKLIGTSQRALETSQQELELQMASSIAGQFNTFGDGLQRQFLTLGDSFGASIREQGVRRFEDDLRLRKVLPGLLDDQIVALRFTPVHGDMEQALLGAEEPPAELGELLASECRRALASHGSAEGHEASLTDPILIGPQKVPGVVVTTAVFSEGEVQGILQGLVTLEGLWDSVALARDTGHEIYALDRRGHLFAHSDPAAVRSGADLRGLEIVQKFLAAKGQMKETAVFSAPRNGKRVGYLGAYDSTSQGWGIFVQVEERSAYAPIAEMRSDTLTWAAVALGLAIVAGIVFAGRLSRPISHLAAVTHAFREGDLSARAQVKANNEIGELGETFNSMAERIQTQIHDLSTAKNEINDLFNDTVRALADAIDAKDPYTRGHSIRVNKYAVVIARYLGLSEKEVQNVHVSSLLHDVGKIGIQDSILKKPAQLSNEEFEIMKQHPAKGAKIMDKIRSSRMREIVPGMQHHHERFGGGGYPLGLKGEDIPLIARIINIADTLDAMTTNRPYQSAFTFEAAAARINELKGSVCDPKVVEAFNRAYRAGEFGKEERQTAEQVAGQPIETA